MKIALSFTLAFLLSAFTIDAPTVYRADVGQSTLNWEASKVTGSHNGFIALKSGSLEMDGSKLTGGEFVIDMATITCEDLTDETYNAKLIGHLKSDDFFSVEQHREASFVITEAASQGGNQYELTGNLTIKGITQEISFPAEVTVQSGQVAANANITVDRTKFDIRYGSGSFFDGLGDKMIYDDFDLTIKLVALEG